MKRRGTTASEAAIERLANLIEYGHLLASTDPPGFLHAVADEIERLRGRCPRPNERTRGADPMSDYPSDDLREAAEREFSDREDARLESDTYEVHRAFDMDDMIEAWDAGRALGRTEARANPAPQEPAPLPPTSADKPPHPRDDDYIAGGRKDSYRGPDPRNPSPHPEPTTPRERIALLRLWPRRKRVMVTPQYPDEVVQALASLDVDGEPQADPWALPDGWTWSMWHGQWVADGPSSATITEHHPSIEALGRLGPGAWDAAALVARRNRENPPQPTDPGESR